ncbi:MAG: hypothetical protein ACKO0Z_04475 [Betaproteobacteria bacterium]
MSTDDEHSEPNPNDYWSISKPTWDAWNRKTKCLLWEAVVLACDVDPGLYFPYGLNADSSVDGVLQPIPGNVQNLLWLAKNALASESLKSTQIESTDLLQSEVDLSDFTTWLNKIRYPRPKEFPWTARELVTGSQQWPWGSHETKGLRSLARAVDRFWKNYDPDDISTAPRNEEVIAWLKSDGVSENLAKAIASLLRPEDLRTGRR